MKTNSLKILVGFLVVSSLAMAVYLLSVYRKTSTLPTATERSVVQTPPKQDPGRAFVTISNAASSVTKGGTWNLNIETNTWATCLIDMYDPNDQVYVLDKDAAKALFISPGKFTWTWKVPADQETGTWVARVLCGTYENLATADQAVELK